MALAFVLQDQPGSYGRMRLSIRDKVTGLDVHEVKVSPVGQEVDAWERTLQRDLDHLSVGDFEAKYDIVRTRHG